MTPGERLTLAAFAGAVVSTMVLYGEEGLSVEVKLESCKVKLRLIRVEGDTPYGLVRFVGHNEILCSQDGSVVLATEVATEMWGEFQARIEEKRGRLR